MINGWNSTLAREIIGQSGNRGGLATVKEYIKGQDVSSMFECHLPGQVSLELVTKIIMPQMEYDSLTQEDWALLDLLGGKAKVVVREAAAAGQGPSKAMAAFEQAEPFALVPKDQEKYKGLCVTLPAGDAEMSRMITHSQMLPQHGHQRPMHVYFRASPNSSFFVTLFPRAIEQNPVTIAVQTQLSAHGDHGSSVVVFRGKPRAIEEVPEQQKLCVVRDFEQRVLDQGGFRNYWFHVTEGDDLIFAHWGVDTTFNRKAAIVRKVGLLTPDKQRINIGLVTDSSAVSFMDLIVTNNPPSFARDVSMESLFESQAGGR